MIRFAMQSQSSQGYGGAQLEGEINLRSSQLSIKLSGDLGLLIIAITTTRTVPPLGKMTTVLSS